MTLTDEHINFIINDITYRGIVDEDLGEELVDHICSLVEEKMQGGERFIEAYDQTMAAFGKEKKLRQLQYQTLLLANNNTTIMVRNYFKIAIRNLVKHKFYSAINIVGLSIGVACSLIIFLFVVNELSYDRFHSDVKNMYRINSHGYYGGNEFHFAVAPAPLAGAMLSEIPEIEQAVRFRGRGTYLVRTPDMSDSFKETRLIFTDSSFFKLFSFPVLEGKKEHALDKPYSIAISQSMANKYYPDGGAMNKSLLLDGEDTYTITAVFKDMPANSHLQFDFLMSMASMKDEANNNMWMSNNFFTYFRLRKDANPREVEEKINTMAESHMDPQLQEFIGKNMEEFKAAGNHFRFVVQPLKDVYLTSGFSFDIGSMGSRDNVYLFAAIAFFILGLACINFMNLSTARSANRAREVGVRKVLGSYRSHLVRQFLVESILMSILSFILGLFLVTIILPFFNDLAGKNLTMPYSHPPFVFLVLFTSIVIGLIAGLYPAFFLSAFRPINTLKGKLSLGAGNGFIRSGLVVFQFFIVILLTTGTVAIYKQLNFIQNKKIGFEKNQVVLINDVYMLGDQRQAFKEEVNQQSQVVSSSFSGFLPVDGYNRNDNSFWEVGKAPTEGNMVNMQIWTIDTDYLKTMGMDIAWGRDFNRDRASDSTAIILNEEAFRRYGLDKIKENWVETFKFDSNSGTVIPDEFIRFHVIGMVNDFHFRSMKESIGPLGMRLGQSTGVLSVKLNTTNFSSSLGQLESTWKKFGSGLPFNYSFLDEAFGNMYRAEAKLARLFTLFAGLAIFIGCLGLFALASFMAEQRTKEIGIRKVLGASVKGIVLMLSKQFSKLVILAFILAVPIAWWGISQWLENYNYKINIGPELFLIAGVLAFVIAWLTVGYQSIRAAVSNPVDSLRNE